MFDRRCSMALSSRRRLGILFLLLIMALSACVDRNRQAAQWIERGEAERAFRALMDRPRTPETWALLSEAATSAQGLEDETIEVFAEAAAEDDPEMILMAARVAEAVDRIGKAREWLAAGLEKHPDNKSIARALAKKLGILGLYLQSAEVLQRYAKGDAVVQAEVGYAYLLAGVWEKGRLYLERSVAEAKKQGAEYPKAQYYLGLYYTAMKDDRRALEHYRRASRTNATLLGSHYQWLATLERLELRGAEYEEAQQAFASAYRPRLLAEKAFDDPEPVLGSIYRGAEVEKRVVAESTRFIETFPSGSQVEVATGFSEGERARFIVKIVGGVGEGTTLLDVVHGSGDRSIEDVERWTPHRLELPEGIAGSECRLEFSIHPVGLWNRLRGVQQVDGARFSKPARLGSATRRSADSRPNILLISLDTLRADRLGSYGSGRDTTPALDRLAGEGVRFDRAEAPSAWTLPSHFSMLSGLSPLAHGVLPNMGDVRGYLFPDRRLPIRGSQSIEMLAERLSAEGYRSVALTENGWVSAHFGFDQGFRIYRSDLRGSLPATLDATLEDLEWAGRRGPWFLFVHTYAPHQPYHAPKAFRSRWADAEQIGFSWPQARVPISDYYRFKVSLFPPALSDIRAYRDLYDGQVAWTDTMVERVLAWLSENGLDEQTIVAVTSDHGEEIFERSEFDHGNTLFEEVSRVPLIIRGSGRIPSGRVVKGPVSVSDLPATLLDLAGVTDRFGEGESLVPLWRTDAEPRGRGAFAATIGHDGELVVALWRDQYKYIRRAPKKGGEGQVEELLFDLDRDPGETVDLSASHEDLLAAMSEALRKRIEAAVAISKMHETEGESVDKETMESLESLGYVGRNPG